MTKVATAFVAALSLMSVSTVASAAPAASKLSIAAPARAGATVAKKNDALGGTGAIIALLGAIGVIAGVILAASADSETATSR
jgi:hypothetical protein